MKSGLKTILSLLMLFAGMSVAFIACNDDDDHVAVPDEFKSALLQKYPDVKHVDWERKGEYRVAEFTKAAVEHDIWFDSNAKLVMTELDYGKDLFLVPDNAVSAAFPKSEYGTWQIDDIKHYIQLDNEFYVFEVEKAGQPDMDVYFSVSGEMLKAVKSDGNPDIRPDTVI